MFSRPETTNITETVYFGNQLLVADSPYKTETLLKIYEALRPHFEPSRLIGELSKQSERYGIVYEEKEGKIVAVAFTWHIDDPYDVVDRNWEYPGEKPDGKYVYLPLIWIDKSQRSYGFLVAFLRKLLAKHRTAKRLAFRRERNGKPKLKILMRFKHGSGIHRPSA